MQISPATQAKLRKHGFGAWVLGNELVCTGGRVAGPAPNPAAQDAAAMIRSFCDARGGLEGAAGTAFGKGPGPGPGPGPKMRKRALAGEGGGRW